MPLAPLAFAASLTESQQSRFGNARAAAAAGSPRRERRGPARAGKRLQAVQWALFFRTFLRPHNVSHRRKLPRHIAKRESLKALTLHPNQLPQTILSPSVLDSGWLESSWLSRLLRRINVLSFRPSMTDV